jgi:Mg2+ and Co2+ transporter CorA
MRTIAYVTLLFLPGALTAAIFGMNFFQFEPASNTVQVANTFWQYWAVTIPFTMLVVAVWNIWNFYEKKKGTIVGENIILPDQQF